MEAVGRDSIPSSRYRNVRAVQRVVYRRVGTCLIRFAMSGAESSSKSYLVRFGGGAAKECLKQCEVRLRGKGIRGWLQHPMAVPADADRRSFGLPARR